MLNILKSQKMYVRLVGLNIIKNCLQLLPMGRIWYTSVAASKTVRFIAPHNSIQKVARLKTGISITVDINDFNGRMLYLCGTVYPEVIDTCYSLLEPGDSFFDIGANYAAVGLSCINAVGNDGYVHIFEPQPNLCERIITTIEKYDLKRAKLHQVGLMDRDEFIDMSRPHNHSGRGSFVMTDECQDKIRLEVKNIATYLPPLIGKRTFGVKVDIEGAEPHIMPWLIQHQQLRFVVFESRHLQADEMAKLFDNMTKNGLALFGIKDEFMHAYLYRITDWEQQTHYQDVLAFRINPSISLPNRLKPTELSKLQKTSSLTS